MKIALAFLCVVGLVVAKDDESRRSYFTAAVFEKAVLEGVETMTPPEILEMNLNFYSRATHLATEKGVDILVFPEFALFQYTNRTELTNYMENVPNPQKEKINPCKQEEVFKDRPILFTLSCLARNNRIYIAVNMVDKQPCAESETCDAADVEGCKSSCPADGNYMYNTNVAFDRKGNLISRYHKNHPYFEQLNIPSLPEYISFKTDFGTFGLIVCFDSLFKHSINLLEQKRIDHMLFLTHWFDDIVPFNAIEWQQSWALENKINFLAANVHYPGMGTIGSGIYSKKFGALGYTYNSDAKSKMVVARVPLDDRYVPEVTDSNVYIVTENDIYEADETGKAFPERSYAPVVGLPKENRTDYRTFKSQFTRYSLKKLEGGQHDVKSCHENFCCSLSYSAPEMNENYYLGAFKGTNDVLGFYKWEEETCVLVRCDALENQECALLPPTSNTVFNHVSLQAEFTAEKVYPTVSKSSYRLAPKYEWKHERVDKTVTLYYKSQSRDPLLKIGLFGRCYSKDPPFIPFFKY